MKVLHAPNEINVYEAGNEFGGTHWILAESLDDAFDEFLTWHADHGDGECDHGGDPEVLANIANPDIGYPQGCDCDSTGDGRHVWAVNMWVRPAKISVDQFYKSGMDQAGHPCAA